MEALHRESFEFELRKKKADDLLRVWVAPNKLRILGFLSGVRESESGTTLRGDILVLLDRITLDVSVKLPGKNCLAASVPEGEVLTVWWRPMIRLCFVAGGC